MDFTEILTVPVILFCIAIWLFVLFQRVMVEVLFSKYWKNIKESKVWRNVFLPFGPIGTGMILAVLLKDYPFPELFNGFQARLLLGVGCGAFAGTVYQVTKKTVYEMVKNKIKSMSNSNTAE